MEQVKWRIEIWSLGNKVDERTYNEDEFEEAKNFYNMHSDLLDSCAPIVYEDGKKLNILQSDKIFNTLSSRITRLFSKEKENKPKKYY